MDSKTLLMLGGVGLIFYWLYQQQLLTSPASSVVSYVPTANQAGNEFSCPTGTVYVDYETSSASGGGYCEVPTT